MRLINNTIFTLILITLFSCNFYSTKGTIPIHISNIYIQPISNQTADQEISNLIDDKLNDLLISQNILEIVDYDTADSKIK